MLLFEKKEIIKIDSGLSLERNPITEQAYDDRISTVGLMVDDWDLLNSQVGHLILTQRALSSVSVLIFFNFI